MRSTKFLLVILTVLFAAAAAPAGELSFRVADVYVETGNRPLGAYQFEWAYDPETVSLVGVEGGDAPFTEAPWYDPVGLTSGRIIVAGFTLADALPSGRVRIARLHLAVRGGEPRLGAPRLEVAAGADAVSYDATITVIFPGGTE